jgi:hypothetical protein
MSAIGEMKNATTNKSDIERKKRDEEDMMD